MAHEFKTIRRVEFADTDAAGMVHFSSYFRYMEAAEHAFHRSLGFSVHHDAAGTIAGWPRLEASCSFEGPLRFEDEMEIHLLVSEKTGKTVTYRFVFRKRDGGDVVARGELTAIFAVKGKGDTQFRAAPIPPEFASKIDVAPPDLLTDTQAGDS